MLNHLERCCLIWLYTVLDFWDLLKSQEWAPLGLLYLPQECAEPLGILPLTGAVSSIGLCWTLTNVATHWGCIFHWIMLNPQDCCCLLRLYSVLDSWDVLKPQECCCPPRLSVCSIGLCYTLRHFAAYWGCPYHCFGFLLIFCIRHFPNCCGSCIVFLGMWCILRHFAELLLYPVFIGSLGISGCSNRQLPSQI